MQLGFLIIGLLFLLVGVGIILFAIFANKRPHFDNGVHAEGVVIDLGVRQPRPFKSRRYSEPAYTKITIEFTTANNQRVQTYSNSNFNLFYTGQYKKGDKVQLLYNPEKPENFIITSSESFMPAKLILIAIGVFILLTGSGMIFFYKIYSSLGF